MANSNYPGVDDHVVERPFTSSRCLLITFAILLGLAAGLYAGWWFWLAGEVRARLDGWAAAMRLDGRTAGYTELSVSGFPGPLRINLTGLDATDPEGGWTLAVPALLAALSPWDITRLDGNFTGPLRLSVDKGPATGRYRLDAGSNAVSLDRSDGGTLRVSLSDVRAAREDTQETLRVEDVKLTLNRGSIPVYGRLGIEATNADLPESMHSAFGGHVARFRIAADATGAELPEGLNADRLKVWADNGGAIDIRSLDVAHGVLGLLGEGTLALDGALQPIGAFTARISGFNAAVDALVRSGVVRREDGSLAKVVLGVLAKPSPGGGPKQVTVPLTVQDRVLSAGPIPLIRLREIHWD